MKEGCVIFLGDVEEQMELLEEFWCQAFIYKKKGPKIFHYFLTVTKDLKPRKWPRRPHCLPPQKPDLWDRRWWEGKWLYFRGRQPEKTAGSCLKTSSLSLVKPVVLTGSWGEFRRRRILRGECRHEVFSWERDWEGEEGPGMESYRSCLGSFFSFWCYPVMRICHMTVVRGQHQRFSFWVSAAVRTWPEGTYRVD